MRDPEEIEIMRYREDLSRLEKKIDRLMLVIDERTSDTRPIVVSAIERLDRIEFIVNENARGGKIADLEEQFHAACSELDRLAEALDKINEVVMKALRRSSSNG